MNYLIKCEEDSIRNSVAAKAKQRAYVVFIVQILPYDIPRNDPEHGSEPIVFEFRVLLHHGTKQVRKTICNPEFKKYFMRTRERAFHVSVGALLSATQCRDAQMCQSPDLAEFNAKGAHVPSCFSGDSGWDVGFQFSKDGYLEGIEFEHDPEKNAELTNKLHQAYVDNATARYISIMRYNAAQY